MKAVGLITKGVLLLLVGAIAPAYAQSKQQEKEQGKPQQEQQHQQAKPAQQQHQQPQKEQAKPAQQQHQQAKPAQQQHQQTANKPAPRPQQTYGGAYHGGVKANGPTNGGVHHSGVPQHAGHRFRLYFGSNHFFRIGGLPMVFVGGYPRFQYDGYWVTFMDPWPESWDPAWYENDDVYLDYTGDGYYLYDRMHPGIGIAVTVAF
jgi:hypothetical protein